MLARALGLLTGLILAVAILIAALTTAITAELTRLALPDWLLQNTTHSDTRGTTEPGTGLTARPNTAPNTGPNTAPNTANPGPSTGQIGSPTASPEALRDIPPAYLSLYQQAAAHACPALPWTVLAAVGKIESNHGRSTLPGVAPGTVNSASAGGVMQFLEPTFDAVIARHPPPSGGANPPSRYNVHDAIYTAAAYLCDSGANHGDLRAALYTYNHSQTYVDQILTQARRYTQPTPNTAPHTPDTPTRNPPQSPSQPRRKAPRLPARTPVRNPLHKQPVGRPV